MDGSHIPLFDPSKMAKVSAADYSSSQSDEDGEDDFLMPSTNPDANEFADYNPRKRRRLGRKTKEAAALGVFGSESEDDGPARRWKRQTLRSKGLNFVSGQAQSKESDEDDDDDEDEQMKDDEDIQDASMLNTGSAAEEEEEDDDDDARPMGLGFQPAAVESPEQPTISFAKSTVSESHQGRKTVFDGSTPLGRGFMPSSARQPTLLVSESNAPTAQVVRPSAFSASRKGGNAKPNAKSFGARMMAKMGYVEGQGLGREGQGRNVIIEATLRPQGIGLGAVKEKTEQERQEERRQARLRGEVIVDSDEEERQRKAARRKKMPTTGLSSGAGSGASTPRRQKPKYLTMDEVKKATPGLNIPDAFTPILDLTGPGKKMLTSSSGLMTPSNEAVPESAEATESRKLARKVQNDFMAIVEEWQSLQERKAFIELQLRHEQQELEELVASVEANLLVSTSCGALLESTQGGSTGEGAQSEQDDLWDRTVSTLKATSIAISSAVLPEVKEELAVVAVAALHPVFKNVLRHWEPLEDPKPRYVDGLDSLGELLGARRPPTRLLRPTATPYEAMLYKLWLPHVTTAVRDWNVREAEQMLSLFEAWQPLLPRFVRTQLLEREIVRRLDEAVQKWEPKRKKHHNLPHLWIFPWLQHLPAHHLDPKSSTGLAADVKRKFRQLIDAWNFGEGVIPGLLQWKDILRPSKGNDQWRPLVMNHVLPSMARYLRANFRVDPGDQEPYMEALEAVFKWQGVIAPTTIAEVVVAEVFPKWLDVLYQWLLSDEVNYEEIAMWLEWWAKEVFPEDIAAAPSIVAEFTRGCALINNALDLGDRAKTELLQPNRVSTDQTKNKAPKHNRHQHHHRHGHHAATEVASGQRESNETSLRTIVEDWCEANDLQFIPERKKVHAEGPLYRITARGDGKGGVLGYFKGDALCIQTKTGPIEIRWDQEVDRSNLLEMVH